MWRWNEFGSEVAFIDTKGKRVSFHELEMLAQRLSDVIPAGSLTVLVNQAALGAFAGLAGLVRGQRATQIVDGAMGSEALKDFIKYWDPDYIWIPENRDLKLPAEPLFSFSGYTLFRLPESDNLGQPVHEDLALVLTTSGYTGSPKFVKISTRNLTSSIQSVLHYLPIQPGSTTITTLSTNYVYGLSVLFTHLCAGGKVVVSSSPIISREFWEELQKFEVTNLNGTPFHYQCISKMKALNSDRCRAIRFLTQAGGKLERKLHAEIAEKCDQSGIQFFGMYGQTEATSRISYLSPEKALTKPGSIGQPVMGGHMRITDENGNEILECGKSGEIEFEGPQVCMGYAVRREDLKLGDLLKGKLKTGDWGWRDEDGDYWITGRISRFVKISDIRISLDHLEHQIRDTYPELDICCTGNDELITLFYQGLINEKVLKESVCRMAQIKTVQVRAVRCREIPRLSSGKIDQSFLNQIDNMGTEEFYDHWDQLDSTQHRTNFLDRLNDLTTWHYMRCEAYRRMLNASGFSLGRQRRNLENIPYVPVSLFKKYDLLSIPRKEVFKELNSSGTSGSAVSRIFLDKENAKRQQVALVRTAKKMIHLTRLPMLIVDHESTVKNRSHFNARTAGINGFSIFSRQRYFALDESYRLKKEEVSEFFHLHGSGPTIVFGFTPLIWERFLQQILEESIQLDLSRVILIHGGGWKTRQSMAVSKKTFADHCKHLGIKKFHEYYGMVEQTGSLFFACEAGWFHCGPFSEVIVRDIHDLKPCEVGQEGILQCLSVLPTSYCGHSLLTEDLGVILGRDNCVCGRPGVFFDVRGRVENTPVKGCGNTHEY